MKLNKKSLVLLVCVTLLLAFTVSGTVAFLADNSGPVVNEFTPVQVTPTVNESFEDNVKNNVKIGNTGNIDAYIRAMVIITWQDADGNVLSTLPVAGTDYSITWSKTDWIDGGDGFYYYKYQVAPGSATDDLLTACKPLKAAPADGYTLHVEILAQSIQATPKSAVSDAWGTTIANQLADTTKPANQ